MKFLSLSLGIVLTSNTILNTMDEHKEHSRSYYESTLRWLGKQTGLLNEQLAGIGDNATEQAKTQKIIRDHITALQNGNHNDKKQFNERVTLISDATQAITLKLTLFNNAVESEKTIYLDDYLPQVNLTIAQAELLVKVKDAIPSGMLQPFMTQKENAKKHVARLQEEMDKKTQEKTLSTHSSTNSLPTIQPPANASAPIPIPTRTNPSSTNLNNNTDNDSEF